MNPHRNVLKIRRKLRSIVVKYLHGKTLYPKIYRSYWHFKSKSRTFRGGKEINYFSAVPNPEAGIGHQLANWIAGYWFAGQFGLKFAHIPFSSNTWERFFGFSESNIGKNLLIDTEGYRQVNLPIFNEFAADEVRLIENIIRSYSDKKVVFVAEQDQFYQDQFGVINDLKHFFYASGSRKFDRLIFSKHTLNIALHIRRGDIVVGQTNGNDNLKMRWQDNSYFRQTLDTLLSNVESSKQIRIFLFSQGNLEDFSVFRDLPDINFCLTMGAQESFLNMVFADILITSKSSFSYKPALLSNGIKIVPPDFWHGYPNSDDWIIAEESGYFDTNKLNIGIANLESN